MMAAAPKGPRPIQPRDCPLFPHAGGTWAKTIDGRQRHFGPWHDLPGALRKWEMFEAARKSGHAPRPLPDGSITLKQLFNRFITFHHARAKSGEITLRSFRDLKNAVESFVEATDPTLPVNLLQPDNFSAYRAKLLPRLGAHALKREIQLVKQMFKWAYTADLIDRPVKYGAGFGGEKKERIAERRRRKDRSFTGAEIRRMVDVATIPLKAMILLGINCGFGNTDIGTLEWADLDLDGGILDTHRHKTGFPRRCTLWGETVDALRRVRQERRKANDKADKDIVFINQSGSRYVREIPELKDGVIVGVSVVDNIPQEFARLMGRLGIYKTVTHPKTGRKKFISDGRGYYCLRRTHRTWSDEMKDPPAAGRIMGHADDSMAGVYVQRIGDERLKVITDHIHAKVFTS